MGRRLGDRSAMNGNGAQVEVGNVMWLAIKLKKEASVSCRNTAGRPRTVNAGRPQRLVRRELRLDGALAVQRRDVVWRRFLRRAAERRPGRHHAASALEQVPTAISLFHLIADGVC